MTKLWLQKVTTTITKIRSRGEQIIALFQKEACRSITFWELISQLLTSVFPIHLVIFILTRDCDS